MAIEAKTVQVDLDGEPVEVLVAAATDENAEKNAVIRLAATVSGITREHTMTIGPAEGPGAAGYNTAQLQADLDRARERIAAEAAWHARVKELLSEVR